MVQAVNQSVAMLALHNDTRATTISSNAEEARTFWSRGRGLMLRESFPQGSALVIDPCSSIHMFFMRFPIDVLYLDSDDRVVRLQRGIKPWRTGPLWTRGAKYVIELPVGTLDRTRTDMGDQIRLVRS
jgi:uncharacterized membrane protein (UPF0127 family)